ncbi:hypothetical protein AU467_20190 [Mesorhizobium loti]|uniref:Uncharacterized protein n=1 Tax=Rhizobium loti TaxID=381 RepID=A0A117N3T5_RHILI|nr:hypothetical protein AU467_20190 [Mesorhizobium loti]
MSTQIAPKYLTSQLAETAVALVLGAVMYSGRMAAIVDGHNCHIVVLVPSLRDIPQADDINWAPNDPVAPLCIYEISVGNREEWSNEFDKTARNKALQLWRGQSMDGNTEPMPHLLFPNDTPFWGGVKRHGIVVATSGLQAYFDQMISGMIADAIKGLASFYFHNSDDKTEGRSFLSE